MKNLLAYAYLMMNFDAGACSPLQVLERVVVRSLRNTAGEQTLGQLRHAVEKDWGFTIPIKVIRYTLGRLSAQQRVHWEYDEGRLEDTYVLRMSEAEKINVKKQEQLARDKYERFRKKVTAVLFRENLGTKYTAGEVIEAWLDKSALSFLGGGLAAARPPSAEDFTFNRIIAKTLGVSGQVDEEAISDLTDLALGDALYRSLKEITELDVDDQTGSRQAILTSKSVQVFNDVGIVTRALGYLGEEQRIAAEEVFKMAREVGYLVCMFEHTLDELREIVSGAAYHLQSGSSVPHRSMVKYALRMGVSATDMLAKSNRLREACQEIGILIIPAPEHEVPLTLDETDLEHRIHVGVKQENPRARQRDIDSLTSIFRLRDGKAKVTLDSCVAIFITHNRTLQDVAHKFFRDHFDSEKQHNVVQLCMTDNVFSSRLWTKLPTNVKYRPKSQIIAFALSNLAPAQGVREAFLARLKELVTKDRINPETAAFVELHDFTNELLALDYRYGDSFDQSEVETVVRRVIDKAKADLKAARETGFEEGIAKSEAYYESVMQERAALAVRFSESTEADLENLRADISQSRSELAMFRGLSENVARVIVVAVLFLICVGTILTALIAAGIIPPGAVAVVISTVASAILTWLTWKGFSGVSLLVQCQTQVQRLLLRWSYRQRKDCPKVDLAETVDAPIAGISRDNGTDLDIQN